MCSHTDTPTQISHKDHPGSTGQGGCKKGEMAKWPLESLTIEGAARKQDNGNGKKGEGSIFQKHSRGRAGDKASAC